MKVDDGALVRRLADGRDEDAFRELYARHAPAVYGFVRRLSGRAGDPDLVMHETWIRGLRDLHLFRGQSTFAVWLSGIAVYCYREWRHRHARSESLDALLQEHRDLAGLNDVEERSLEEVARVSVQPPSRLEGELVTALRARGLLRPRRVASFISMAERVADRLHFRRRGGGDTG